MAEIMAQCPKIHQDAGKTGQDGFKIGPRHAKIGPRQAKTGTDRLKTGPKDAKKRARERKRANIDPTWRSLDLDLGSFWPPLRKEKQYDKASIKCSGI